MAGEFSDEEWDISDDQLQQLEQNAILCTQQQQAARNISADGGVGRYAAAQTSPPGTLNLANNNYNNNYSDLRRAAAGVQFRNGPPPQPKRVRTVVSEGDSFDNPSLDKDGVPLVVEEEPQPYRPQAARQTDETSERERWKQSRHVQRHGPMPQPQPRQSTSTVPRKAIEEYKHRYPQLAAKYGTPVSQSPSQANQPNQPKPPAEAPARSADDEALQAELEELRKERESLQRDVKELTTKLYTARGEVSNVRARTAQDLKVAERQAEMLKKQMQEENIKHQAVLQSKEEAYNKLMTDNNFMKHELDEQSRKLRDLQRQARERPLQDRPNDVNWSPRKGVTSNLRDGFDDDVIMQMSPGRSPARRRSSKPSTPTKKRKHPSANDIDGPTLVLRLSGEQPQQSATIAGTNEESRVFKDKQSEEHLQFLRDVLAFCPGRGQDTMVEALIKFSFPNHPTRNLSSLLLEEMPKLEGQKLPRDMLLILMRFLSRCTAEGYYKPVEILLECVLYILELEPTIVDNEVIEAALPPLESLAKHNASKRYLLADRTKIWNAENPKPRIDPDVNTTACLEVMLTIASLVVDEMPLLQLFWKWMQTDTLLLLLHPSQRPKDITIVLDMLLTSVLPNTFGLITSPQDLQARTETYVLDKIAFLLWDPPRHFTLTRYDKMKSATPIRDRLAKQFCKDPEPAPEPEPSRVEICHLRLKALEVFSKIVMTSIPHPHKKNIESHHGTNFILKHVNATARLVRFLYDEVTHLYDGQPDTRHLHAELVNRGTALLHHILLSPQALAPSSDFNLAKSLSGTLVGSHKFRVVMTRLALGHDASSDIPDGYGLDAGVTEETRDLAREIVGEYVTPDEATQLTAAFGLMAFEDEAIDADGEDPDEAEAAVMAEVER